MQYYIFIFYFKLLKIYISFLNPFTYFFNRFLCHFLPLFIVYFLQFTTIFFYIVLCSTNFTFFLFTALFSRNFAVLRQKIPVGTKTNREYIRFKLIHSACCRIGSFLYGFGLVCNESFCCENHGCNGSCILKRTS